MNQYPATTQQKAAELTVLGGFVLLRFAIYVVQRRPDLSDRRRIGWEPGWLNRAE